MCYFFLTSLHFFFFFFHSHLRNVERDEFRLLPIFILFSCAFPNYFARRENVLMHPHSCCITDRETRLNSLNCKHPCHKSRETCRTILILVQALWWILVEKPLDYSNHCQTFDSFFLSVFLYNKRMIL